MPTALITGGTSGIGKATALGLHRRAFRVAVTGRNPDSLAAARADLPEDVLVQACDIRSLPETDVLIHIIREQFGSLDVLFLNAGVSHPAPVQAVTEDSFDDQVGVNLRGQFFTLQKALPLLSEGASIVLTAGAGISRGMVGGTVTAATRGALLALMPSLALELAPRNIRVNAVSPGGIDTPIWDGLGLSDEARAAITAEIPFRRFGSSDEVAEVVAFLATDAASYVTGQEIAVAGGW